MNSSPRKRLATATSSSVIASSTTANACRKPSLVRKSDCCVMCIANIWSPGPPSSVGVMKKPSAETNTSSPPAATLGSVCGNSTRQNTASGPAPAARPARSTAGSSRVSPL
jgi:hypothetical protein